MNQTPQSIRHLPGLLYFRMLVEKTTRLDRHNNHKVSYVLEYNKIDCTAFST